MPTTYPMNLLGKQFHFDVDGTVGQALTSARVLSATLTAGQLKNASDWNLTASLGYSYTVGGFGSDSRIVNMFFPEARTLTEWAASLGEANGTATLTCYYSTNTTNGIDGTWTSFGTTGEAALFKPPSLAMLLTPVHVNIPGVRGVEYRIAGVTAGSTTSTYSLYCMHLYGTYTQAGVEFWHPTSNIPLPPNSFNLGDVSRSASYSPTFRIKNQNAQTANNVVISAKEGIGTMLAGTTFSDGGAYAASVTIASIATGAISPVITMKRTVGAGETQNTNNMLRVAADVTSWT
jgi:hypothetical protein